MDYNDGFEKWELENLKEGLTNLMYDLEHSEKEVEDFFNRPITFLKKYKIKILDYIKTDGWSRMRFTGYIRELIGSLRGIVNRCLGCKLAVLFIMTGLIGKANLAWTGIMEVIDAVIDSLKKYFKETSNKIDRFFANLDDRVDRYRPSHLALLICEMLGYCPA